MDLNTVDEFQFIVIIILIGAQIAPLSTENLFTFG